MLMLPMSDDNTIWDNRAKEAAKKRPLKELKTLPNMVGITPSTARHLKWKSLKYMVLHDKGWKVTRQILRHPLRYGWSLLRSLLRKKAYEKREGDFYFYNVSSLEDFEQALEHKKTLLVIGFSYCHKPLECPSGRFTPECIADSENLVCQQCFIGKVKHLIPQERLICLIIPTIHYIGEKILEIVHAHPYEQVCFLITTCELAMEMFGDYGKMANLKGLGVRLDGRICNTLEAFVLSEEGIKPGLTVVLPETQERILAILRKGFPKRLSSSSRNRGAC
ncbi:MAG: hypothetical protein JSR80_05915 [Verrucomicrobia bacterium]|nr:hypothetical protein [Verrucomicrobiota bacterium]